MNWKFWENATVVDGRSLGTIGKVSGAVVGVYLLTNIAFLKSLGYANMASSAAVAADTMATVFPVHGRVFISMLICISALGAMNGLILVHPTEARATGIQARIQGFSKAWLGCSKARQENGDS